MAAISIIIPVYNTESYLQNCLDSIQTQTYTDYEVLCVNDGSTDNSLEILNKYASKDNRIKVFNQKNQGQAIARNLGIANAQGEYIVFIDSDDSISENYLEEIKKTFESSEADFVVLNNFYADYTEEDLQYIGGLPTWRFAVSKELLTKYPEIKFPNICPCEDGIFSFKLLCLASKISVCNGIKYNYIQRSDSSEHTHACEKILKDMPNWFNIVETFLNEYKLWEKCNLRIIGFIFCDSYQRFLNFPFTIKQKARLFNIVHNFLNKHPQKYCLNYYDGNYQLFINTNSYFVFWLTKLLKKLEQTLFSIRNEYPYGIKHKVITILGIKIKFQVHQGVNNA